MVPLEKRPGKIICVGMNYPPFGEVGDWSPPPYPVLFQKPSSALVGPGEKILLPRISQKVLYEGELVIVIGRKAYKVSEAESLSYVQGFTIANDVGAADIEERSSQWASGKMFDTFCPIGPVVVPVDDIAKPDALKIETRLNGQVVQVGNTGEMIFGVKALISYISHLTTLDVGDLILTGAPKRSIGGPDPRTPLKPGDWIEISIERIGILENPVVAKEEING